jgi:hypothetical protein
VPSELRRTTRCQFGRNRPERSVFNTLCVLGALRQRPILSLPRLCEDASMTFPAASKTMLRLDEVGIARELTGRRRNRVFACDAYPAILNERGEPL